MSEPGDDLLDLVLDLVEAITLVTKFFQGDAEKARLWFKTPSTLLGDISPRDLIRAGRSAKLVKFIRTMLAENIPPGE